ncbi:hypothetical protein RHMOL_Rhmol09G0151800 [Rhododendron molle]|uniref:Uncharacterized protein n=1 Tax=Rhododendron molle TaxID=49168 RepID=A0ACC0MEU2_RHOML|nr:hypothetical protein RHMOL_Rhmol09G0151800 [Rhododendron molle]
MGFPSFLGAFFLVSHLLVLHSSSSCPSSFNCGKLPPLKFPFTNNTHPRCGWFNVSCDEPVPQVKLGADGRSYQITDFSDDTISLKDHLLETQIKSKDCNFSDFINPLNTHTHSVSFTLFPNLTLFRCANNEFEMETEKRFPINNYIPYRGGSKSCHGYTVYFSYPNQPGDQVPTPGNIPENCVFFQLPVASSDDWPRNLGDPFNLLTSEFSVEYHLSEECLDCHEHGGQCPRVDTGEFQCMRRAPTQPPTHPPYPEYDVAGRKRLGLILGTVVPTIGILVILLFCIIIKKLSKSESTFFWGKKTENYQNIEAFLKNCGSLSLKRYTYSDIKKITNSFRTKLGQGGFGCVFKGKLENDYLVAVKVLKGLKGNGEEFINEIATISRTSHVNIVTLLGFYFEGRHRALIYEFMPNGSLDKFIHDGGSLTYLQLSWEALYRIVVGIARGLEYLHRGCNTRILHFDIKPHNILLNEDFCPKISDFGLAKLCPQKESIISLSGARGTVGYIAPEVFSRHFGGVSHKSDVYSYGMMVLEMIGVRKNISVEVDHSSETYFPHWVYKRLELDEELGLHGNMDDEANASARKMIIVSLWCIQTDPSHRPSMSRVVEMLEGSLESLQIPPKPFLSSPSRSPVQCAFSTQMSLTL